MTKKQSNSIKPYCDRMTVTQVAAFFGVHLHTVRNWVKKGQLPAVMLPSGYIAYIPTEEVTKFNISAMK